LIKISWKLARNVILIISRSCSNMDLVGLKTRPHSPNMEKRCEQPSCNCSSSNILEIGEVSICVTWIQILGHTVEIWKNIIKTQKTTVFIQYPENWSDRLFWWCVSQFWIWETSWSKELGHIAQIKCPYPLELKRATRLTL
jgi:hypothetical protein